MSTVSPHLSISASIERAIKSLATDNWTYVFWEDRDETQELPTGDIIGPMGLGWLEDDPNEFAISVAVAVSTTGDANRFRMKQKIDDILKLFVVGSSIPLFRWDTKVPVGEISIVSPRSVMPIASSEQRVIQLVQLVLVAKLPKDLV